MIYGRAVSLMPAYVDISLGIKKIFSLGYVSGLGDGFVVMIIAFCLYRIFRVLTSPRNKMCIRDSLKDKRTVVLNLEQTNKDVARRLVDFLSGVAYANEGKIKKVANSTYIITPYNVDIMGDLIDELERCV